MLMKRLKMSRGIHAVHCLVYGFAKHFFLYVLIIVAVMAATSFSMYLGKENTVTATLTLNYEEAAKGLYPNSTRFSISLIKSQEVMERVIEMAGLENITPEQLSNHITAQGVNVHNIQGNSDSNYRIATSYSITYRKNPEIKRISARDILELIIQAYKEEFFENYAYGKATLTCDIEPYESLEYLEIAEMFKREGNKLYRHLNSMMKDNGTFLSEKTQETFSSLKKRAYNFLNIDLEKFSSYVKQSGLSKDKAGYISKLEYQNHLMDISYQKLMGEYSIRLGAIDLYDAALTAVVLVPTVDTSLEFYMSRTKVAIDYQAELAESASSSANDYNEKMNENKHVMEMLDLAGASSASAKQKAEEMIQTMKAELEGITNKTVVTNQEYIRYKTKNYLSTSYVEKSLSDMLSIKWAILAGGFVTFAIGCWILILESRRKEEQ